MIPSVVGSEIRRALLDYLKTTFRLQDAELEAALFRYLESDETGMFQGPYVDVRLPFRQADERWESSSPLDFGPPFVPYAHQLRAFERLSARDRVPQNTLITTGTGSGKTECFLYPVLDHCRRARQRGELGIKAIVLYPMNALASDQAERLAKLLRDPLLHGVSAGLYVGGKGQHAVRGASHLVDDREILRKSPPDILLTNYRMLDFLLMRPEDGALWALNGPHTLRYLVLDELHTYDGAQGSDVACLIRRLKARLDIPSGHLCCVGTSATIGSGGAQDPRQLLADFATQIFAEPFSADSLIGEERLTPDEAFLKFESKPAFPYIEDRPDWTRLDATRYARHEAYLLAQVEAWFGDPRPRGPSLLAESLGAHPFMAKLLRALAGRERRSGPRHVAEVMSAIASEEPSFAELSREQQWLVLSSFVSLIAHARSTDASGERRPFLQVQVQLWIREVHGLLRRVGSGPPAFAWQDDLKTEPGEHWLPLVFCRECGFSGYAAALREGETAFRDAPGEIGEVFLHNGNRGRVIEVLGEQHGAERRAGVPDQACQKQLCPRCLSLGADGNCRCDPRGIPTLPVRVHPELDEDNKPGPLRRCPDCQADDALSFLASRAATLSSVAVSELFSSRFNADKKLLAFTDSVQDASHRAGFFASRTFRFALRTVVQALVEHHAGQPLPLASFAAGLIRHWSEQLDEPRAAALLMPPDLVEDP
ncbi:MAG TPA: DEAD/DEAH box helicase, partial [Polyangiaceae bacterium]|nr:DEAD/DEAH box helicase [Polyangiaceae bacterium]